MPRYTPFPAEAKARFERLTAALKAYVDDAHVRAGSEDAYCAFRLRDEEANIDAFVCLGACDDGPCDTLISFLVVACVKFLYLQDGAPLFTEYYGEPRR